MPNLDNSFLNFSAERYPGLSQMPFLQLIPSLSTIFLNSLSQTLIQIQNNPLGILYKTLLYQMKITGHIAQAKNFNELMLLSHEELQNYYLELVELTNLEPKDYQYLTFCIKQFFNAYNPENLIFFNNQALGKCVESKLQNLSQSIKNWQHDLTPNDRGHLSFSNVDKTFFILGKNIASTEGKVIYKNSIMELICYKPKNKAFSTPILIITSCINRYYVLDLSKSNSFVKWLVDNNFQVFILSWANPKSSEQNFTFEDYLKLGIMESAQYIKKTFGYNKINAIGYCIGGTMLATLMGYCAKRKINLFNSVTFFNTLLDFEELGDMATFIRPEIIDQFKILGSSKGYLDGIHLHNFFNLLKSKELIWSTYIKKYLEGSMPKAFDILYWNADYTNLPLNMLEFYLNKFCLSNTLIKPNQMSILGNRIDLSRISIPSFFVAAKKDHIVSWEQCYKGVKYLGGQKTFCLTESGHIAGILNHPKNNKYNYWSGEIQDDSDKWFNNAQTHPGSWWNLYLEWLKPFSGEINQAIDYQKINSLSPAPGSFCLV